MEEKVTQARLDVPCKGGSGQVQTGKEIMLKVDVLLPLRKYRHPMATRS